MGRHEKETPTTGKLQALTIRLIYRENNMPTFEQIVILTSCTTTNLDPAQSVDKKDDTLESLI